MTDPAELAARVQAGELRLHELEAEAAADDATAARRAFLAEETGEPLETVGAYGFDAAVAKPNIENMIGAVQIPMGVAGPLPVGGDHADGRYYLPLATTEGALVASVNRGCRALRAAGGAGAAVTGLDCGVVETGRPARLVVLDGDSDNLAGAVDPVRAVVRRASVDDVVRVVG